MAPDLEIGGLRRLFRALLPRSWWGRALLIAVPLLLVLFALAPFVTAVQALVELLGRIVAPLVENATGRLLLLNILLLVAGAVAFLALRDRIAAFRSGLLLRRHLDGIGALVEGETRRARELLARVARSEIRPPADVPDLAIHARLALARIGLEEGDASDAMRWLSEVRGGDLPDEFAHSLAQLRFRATDQQGEALPEELERELLAALEVAPRDRWLLGRLRELQRDRGAFADAAETQARIVDAAPPGVIAAERTRLARDLVVAGEAILLADPHAGSAAREFAERARRVDADAPESALLKGDSYRAEGQVVAALRCYASAADLDALSRAAALLDAFPRVVAPRELLEAFPLDGGLVLLAREYARAGDARAALRAGRLALRQMPGRLAIIAAVAEVFRQIGEPAEADRLVRDALRSAVAFDDPAC